MRDAKREKKEVKGGWKNHLFSISVAYLTTISRKYYYSRAYRFFAVGNIDEGNFKYAYMKYFKSPPRLNGILNITTSKFLNKRCGIHFESFKFNNNNRLRLTAFQSDIT